MLGTANANLILPAADAPSLKVALLGVEPGRPGEPPVKEGRQLSTNQAKEVIIDKNTALRSKLMVGDMLTLRVTQGIDDEFYTLRVVGIADGQQYALQPAIFVPFNTWTASAPNPKQR